ncbi:MAG: metallophosphoesterase [Victivallales bacterium]|nr:metallophosphoesterase [Victivallales bacterium]
MKIIQFSDIHAGGPAEDWMGYFDKRWVGVFNYSFRRKFQHDLNKLHTAVDYILAEKPDLAVCTGDLTSTGQPGEFEKVKVILKRIVESDVPLFFVPGNHDFYVYRKRCVNAMKYMVKYLNQGKYDFDRLPVVLEHGGLDFVIINECWPSNLLSSHGWVKPAHSRQVENFCSGEKTRPRVLIGHYPLIEEHPIKRARHRLYGQKTLSQLLKEQRIDLSLCGHVHKPYAKLDEHGRGEICAGSVTRNSCMAKIEYEPNDNIFKYERIMLN